MKIPWANDPWFGEDKLTHAVWTYAGAVTFALLFGWFIALVLVVGVSIAVELVQWVRWDIWHNHVVRAKAFGETPDPQPIFSDQPSYKDLAYDGAGMVLGLLFVWLYLWLLVARLH